MSASGGVPAVDVAIVSWNTSRAALRAAGAFIASEDAEARVTLHDNASDPPEREILEREAGPGIELVLAPRNSGYSRAANAALARGERSVRLRQQRRCGARAADAGGARVHGGGGSEPRGWSGRSSPAAATATTPGFPSAPVLAARLFAGRAGTRVPPLPRGSEALEVEQPSGACFLMRRDAWEAAGGFDEEFFLWYEDVDLARRLLAGGRRNLVVGAAVAHHQGGSSFNRLLTGPRPGHPPPLDAALHRQAPPPPAGPVAAPGRARAALAGALSAEAM